MDIEYNDICKKMEAKGYEYIQEIRAYCEYYTSESTYKKCLREE